MTWGITGSRRRYKVKKDEDIYPDIISDSERSGMRHVISRRVFRGCDVNEDMLKFEGTPNGQNREPTPGSGFI